MLRQTACYRSQMNWPLLKLIWYLKNSLRTKLKVDWKIDQNIRQHLIPALLLQPLAENVINYDGATQQSATITIVEQQHHCHLCPQIQDDCPTAGGATGLVAEPTLMGINSSTPVSDHEICVDIFRNQFSTALCFALLIWCSCSNKKFHHFYYSLWQKLPSSMEWQNLKATPVSRPNTKVVAMLTLYQRRPQVSMSHVVVL